MTESEKADETARAGAGRPAWEESFSREIEDLAAQADAQRTEWKKGYADDVFGNPPFVREYSRLVRGHSVQKAFKCIYGRSTGNPETSELGFLDRFEKSATALSEGLPIPDPVPIGIFYYLEESVAQGRAQKSRGEVPDPDPIAQVLEFGKTILDHPNLSAFRIDVLAQFPSNVEAEVPDAGGGNALPSKPNPEKGKSELPEGYLLGKLVVVRLLGEGGFAQVYLVFYPALQEYRAAKVFTNLHVHGPEYDRVRKAFDAEAILQNRLKHPNIVRVLDVDEHEGYLVLIMEYVDGRNLRSLIEEKKKAKTYLTPHEIIRIAIDVTKALAFAHSLLILHRDLKPENIIIDQEGVAKVLDYGLAKTLNDSGERLTTRLGNLIGTPQYMAPEQVFVGRYDHRLDLYALGVVLYQMAYGEVPLTAKDPWAVLEKQRTEKPVPLVELREGFPEDLDRIVLKLLEKNPDDRYSTATELLQALEACQSGLSTAGPSVRRRRMRPLLSVAGIAALLVALVLGVFGFRAFKTGKEGRPPLFMEEQQKLSLTTKKDESSPAPLKDSLYPAPEPLTQREETKETPISTKDARPDAAGMERAKLSEGKGPDSKPELASQKKTVPPPPVPTLREQLAAAPPGAADSAVLDQILDLFSKHRSETLARSYSRLAKDLESFGLNQSTKNEFLAYELGAASDLVRLATELVEARFRVLARSKEEIHLKLADGSVTAGVVEEVNAGAITLVNADRSRASVEFSRIAPEEFQGAQTAPLAELAFQALSGDAGKALADARLLEKDQERIVLWYPLLVRMARLDIQERVRAALFDALESLAKGDHGEDLPARLAHYPQASGALKAFEQQEATITPLFGSLVGEFDRARAERDAMSKLLQGQYSRVLSVHPGTQAHPLAAKLLIANFLQDFEAPAMDKASEKTDELIASGGWMRYGWRLQPAEKTVAEGQQFWQLDSEKEGSILRDPVGPRSLIMYEPHPRISEGIVLRFEFEPLGDGILDSQWRLLVMSDAGHDNYLRFDSSSIGLFRKFNLEPGATLAPLLRVTLPQGLAEPKMRCYVLIPGDEGFHLFVDGELVVTISKKECILPLQLQVAVLKGKLSMKSIRARKELKK